MMVNKKRRDSNEITTTDPESSVLPALVGAQGEWGTVGAGSGFSTGGFPPPLPPPPLSAHFLGEWACVDACDAVRKKKTADNFPSGTVYNCVCVVFAVYRMAK
jgi:hypothetical protein